MFQYTHCAFSAYHEDHNFKNQCLINILRINLANTPKYQKKFTSATQKYLAMQASG